MTLQTADTAPRCPTRRQVLATPLATGSNRFGHFRSKHVAVFASGVLLPAAIWLLPLELSRDGRMALTVLVLAVMGWTVTRLSDTLVALAAALVLAITGVIKAEQLFATLGHELIWLLIAAFVISAHLRASGLVERLVFSLLHRVGTVRHLFFGLTGVIAATAFVIPATSSRAALMLPVFLALAERIDSDRIIRALALLFPTIILLSATGSLIGAGAHIVAVDFIAQAANERIDYLGWLVVALPFALLSSVLATLTILRLFLTSEEASLHLDIGCIRREQLTLQQITTVAIVLVTVGLWIVVPGQPALIALVSALALLLPRVAALSPREAFKAINVELIVFLAAAFAIAEALPQSGVDRWLAQSIVEATPASVTRNTPAVIALVSLVSLLGHLIVASRTARVTVLIPALALPLAGLGHDPMLLILVTVMGSSFCQTLAASAKPVVLFAHTERPTYTPSDLLRLSAALLPIMFALLMLFACAVWSS